MAKNIMQIMQRRSEIKASLINLKKEYESAMNNLQKEDAELNRLELIFSNDVANICMIQIAESVLSVGGDGVDKVVNGRRLTDAAALDIATGSKHLRHSYYGNKQYESFYQSCDCKYGYGPSHGSIVDKISLKDPEKELTKEESEACIYYLKNYSKINKELAVS